MKSLPSQPLHQQTTYNLKQNKTRISTDNLIISSCTTRKKYYVKKHSIQQQFVVPQPHKKSNIFNLANDNTSIYSQITNNTVNFSTQSRIFQSTNTLIDNQPFKALPTQNPQQPISLNRTKHRYSFVPTISFPKVIKKPFHQKDPIYIKNLEIRDQKNITNFKKYQKLWLTNSLMRKNSTQHQKSAQSAQKSISNYNKEVATRKANMQFQLMVRNRYKDEENHFGIIKGIPKLSIKGLKGKGGNNIQSLFQQMIAIEQVEKIHK